jgi:hypothetical protein
VCRSRETLKGVEEDCQGALNPGWTRRKLGKEGTESGGWRRLITARDCRGGNKQAAAGCGDLRRRRKGNCQGRMNPSQKEENLRRRELDQELEDPEGYRRRNAREW